MTARFDIVTVGRPSLDLIFTGLPRWPAVGLDMDVGGFDACAGASFNVAAAANRLGFRVGYVAMIGNDPCSELIRREFDAEDLPVDLLSVLDRPLPFVSVALNHDHDRGFVTYAADGDDEELALGRRAEQVVTSGAGRHLHLYATDEPDLPGLAHAAGMTVSLDAWDGQWWDGSKPLEAIFADADVLFANEAEALAMTGEQDVAAAVDRLSERCGCVVIKRGADGAMARSGDDVADASAEPVTVVDTTGAGDCFNAGFLYGWLRRMPLVDSLTIANICAGGTVTMYGGYRGCPREAELLRIAGSRGIVVPSGGEP